MKSVFSKIGMAVIRLNFTPNIITTEQITEPVAGKVHRQHTSYDQKISNSVHDQPRDHEFTASL